MAEAPVDPGPSGTTTDRWTRDNVTVLAVCTLGWAFDIYESTITQLVTPILIREWDISPATMGAVTTVSRWIGLIGAFTFPVLADLYGRKPALIWSILGFSLLTGLTGFATGWMTLLIYGSLTRIFLSGENPVGTVMVTETAPTRWRVTALSGVYAGYPLGYMACSAVALVAVPLWGWRSMYFIGILPALLVLFVRFGIKESPRHERVTAQMLKEGMKRRLDIVTPFRRYPRETIFASSVAFLYLFTWIGWSAWMPFFLATEKKLGFEAMASYLAIWMGCAFFAYWICGWLCDLFGRRWVIPGFMLPAAACLVAIGHIDDPTSLFWFGLVANFLLTGSFGPGLGYINEPFPTQVRGAGVAAAVTLGLAGGSLAPVIVGAIATSYSVAAALPLLAFTAVLLVPMFAWVIPDTTRRELTDFVGQRVA